MFLDILYIFLNKMIGQIQIFHPFELDKKKNMKQFPNNRSLYTQTPIFFVINQAFPWPVLN
jgi:hypothetical protein